MNSFSRVTSESIELATPAVVGYIASLQAGQPSAIDPATIAQQNQAERTI